MLYVVAEEPKALTLKTDGRPGLTPGAAAVLRQIIDEGIERRRAEQPVASGDSLSS